MTTPRPRPPRLPVPPPRARRCSPARWPSLRAGSTRRCGRSARWAEPPVHAQRPGRLDHRRRREHLRRPGRLLGSDDPGAPPPRGDRRGEMPRCRRGSRSAPPASARWNSARRSSPACPVDEVRLVSSGTEATMSAIRLARGFTGRTAVVKFAGCYHGHVDALLASAGSGVATLALPDSAGVPGEYHRRRDRAALQRHRRGSRPLSPSTATGSPASSPRRPRPTWAWCRRRPGSTRRCRRADPGARRPADQRRGDDRIPAVPQRHVRPRRGGRGLDPGPDDVRQGDRRRAAGRRLRRPVRRDGAARAGRAGLPGGHAVR